MQGKTTDELKHNPYLYKEKQGKNIETKTILIQGKTGEEKGRVEKLYLHLYRERQGKNWKTLPIYVQGKSREEQSNKNHIDEDKEELKNITHIHIGKDKGRTAEQYPYSFRERQGKNRETKAILIK